MESIDRPESNFFIKGVLPLRCRDRYPSYSPVLHADGRPIEMEKYNTADLCFPLYLVDVWGVDFSASVPSQDRHGWPETGKKTGIQNFRSVRL